MVKKAASSGIRRQYIVKLIIKARVLRIRDKKDWIPAFAGMTLLRPHDGLRRAGKRQLGPR
jgi:hypothetical protein